jgi:hypothetical protein
LIKSEFAAILSAASRYLKFGEEASLTFGDPTLVIFQLAILSPEVNVPVGGFTYRYAFAELTPMISA